MEERYSKKIALFLASLSGFLRLCPLSLGVAVFPRPNTATILSDTNSRGALEPYYII